MRLRAWGKTLVVVSVLVCMALLHPSLQLNIPTPMDPHTYSKSVSVVVEMKALSPSPVEEDDGGNSGVAIVLLKCPPSLPYLLVKEYDFSPLLDVVPGYVASNVSIRIPADCHLNSSIVNNKERVDEVDTNFLTAMQSFLYRYLPLLEETTTSSIPIIAYNNNNDYDYEQCDGCKMTTLSKINKRQENNGDDDDNGNGNPSNLHRRRRRCNRIRGRRGLWRYDAAYANASYYVDTRWIMGKELAHGPYNHSSWMWQQPSLEDADDNDNDNGYYNSYCGEEGEDVELLTRDGFCRSVTALNITRLMVLGDSMEYMRLISFFHIIGEWRTPNVHSHLQPRFRMRHEQSIVCNSSSTGMESNTANAFTVSVVFYRTNHLMPLLVETKASNNNETIPPLSQQEKGHHQMQQRMGTEKGLQVEYFVCYSIRKPLFPDEDGYCPWQKEYLSYDPDRQGRTLLLSGVGPHFHSMPAFKEMFTSFVAFLDRHPRPSDVVWLRTVSAGHDGCSKVKDPEPLHTFGAFQQKYASSTEHDWNLFVMYNRYMEMQSIRIRNNRMFPNQKNWLGASVDLLDVYWMTALRHDGHPSSIDCMHYLLPGPPDWWNHLLYSNLKEFAEVD